MTDAVEFRRNIEAARRALAAGEDAVVDYLLHGVHPADTRECDGFPGLASPDEAKLGLAAATPCPCGDPGDCAACS